jgi:hypothetical protein
MHLPNAWFLIGVVVTWCAATDASNSLSMSGLGNKSEKSIGFGSVKAVTDGLSAVTNGIKPSRLSSRKNSDHVEELRPSSTNQLIEEEVEQAEAAVTQGSSKNRKAQQLRSQPSFVESLRFACRKLCSFLPSVLLSGLKGLEKATNSAWYKARMYWKGISKFAYSCLKYYIKGVTILEFEGTWGLIKWLKQEWDREEDSTDDSADQQESQPDSEQDLQQESQVPAEGHRLP